MTKKAQVLYHNTKILLQKYREVTWSLLVYAQRSEAQFAVQIGKSIDDFLESAYTAGITLSGSKLEHQAQCIARSREMLRLLDSAVNIIRANHPSGESFYWLLYYTYLSPTQLHSVDEVIENIRSQVRFMSRRTYYRMREEAITTLATTLWGYTSQDVKKILDSLIPPIKTSL